MALTQDKIQLEVEINGGQRSGETIKDLEKNVKTLRAEMKGLAIDSDEYVKKMAELQAASSRLAAINADMRGMQQSFGDQLKGNVKEMFSFSGAMDMIKSSILPLIGLQAAVELFIASFNAFKESAAASAELSRALKGNIEDIDALTKQSQELQNVTLFDDNQIQQAQAMLASMGGTRAEIEQLTPLVLDYAQKMNIDAAGAAEVFGVALEQTAGPLEDMGVKYEEGATRAEKFAIIQSTLNNRIGGAAETAANAGGTAMQRFSNRTNDLLESVGALIANGLEKLEPLLDIVFKLLEGGVWVIDKAIGGLGLLYDAFKNGKTFILPFLDPLLALVGGFEGLQKTVISVMNKIGEFADFVRDKLADIGVLSENSAQAAASAQAKRAEQMAAAAAEARAKEIQAETEANAKKADEQAKADAEAAKKAAEQRKKNAEEAAKQTEENNKRIRDLQTQAITDELARNQQAIRDKLADDLAGLRGTAQEKATLTTLLQQEANAAIKALNDKAAADKAKAAADLLKKQEDENAKRIEAEKAYQAELVRIERETLDAQLDNIGLRQEQEALALRQLTNERIEAAGTDAEALLQVKESYEAQQLEMERRYAAERLAALQASGQATEAEILAQKNKELDIVEKQNARKVANEKRTADAKENIEVQQRQLAKDSLAFGIEMLSADEESRKEYGNAIKALKVAQIAMNLQEEISGYWSTNAMNPANVLFPGFVEIMAGIKTGFAVARAAMATSTVISQKFSRGGLLVGPSHAEGGVPMTVNGVGGYEGEGGEIVMNKRASWMYRNLLSDLNYSTGGVRFAEGGVLTPPSIPSSMTGGMNMGSMRIEQVPSPELIALYDMLGQKLDNIPSHFTASVAYTDLETTAAEVNAARQYAKG